MPAFRSSDRLEVRQEVHQEAFLWIVSPPTSEARQISIVPVSLVNKAARDGARAAVEILVRTPHCEIHAPVVQLQRHIARRVRQVEPDRATLLMRQPRHLLQVIQLTREKIHAGQHHQRDLIALVGQRALDVLRSDGVFAVARLENHERVARVIAVMLQLAFDCVRVGREGWIIDQDLIAVFGWPIEADHHEVQVDGQAVHHDHFARQSADQPRPGLAEQIMVRIPRRVALEMSVDRRISPVVHFLLDHGPRRFRLQAQRVAAKVDHRLAVRPARNVKLLAITPERVRLIKLSREIFIWLELRIHGEDYSTRSMSGWHGQ